MSSKEVESSPSCGCCSPACLLMRFCGVWWLSRAREPNLFSVCLPHTCRHSIVSCGTHEHEHGSSQVVPRQHIPIFFPLFKNSKRPKWVTFLRKISEQPPVPCSAFNPLESQTTHALEDPAVQLLWEVWTHKLRCMRRVLTRGYCLRLRKPRSSASGKVSISVLKNRNVNIDLRSCI